MTRWTLQSRGRLCQVPDPSRPTPGGPGRLHDPRLAQFVPWDNAAGLCSEVMGSTAGGEEAAAMEPGSDDRDFIYPGALFAQIEKLIGELHEARKSSRRRGKRIQREALPVRFLSHSHRYPCLIRSSGLMKDLGFRHAQVRESSNTLCMVIPPNSLPD
jgi:hypothetical protein